MIVCTIHDNVYNLGHVGGRWTDYNITDDDDRVWKIINKSRARTDGRSITASKKKIQ